MSGVVLYYSMTVDGFVAGPDVTVSQAMGAGGEVLHSWMDDDGPGSETNKELIAHSFDIVGAVVLGNRTLEVGLQFWQDTPFPAPSFVVTHKPRPPMAMKSADFTFVTEGIEKALDLALAAAGDKDVVVMGASVSRQVIGLKRANRLHVQLVPALLGTGERIFDDVSGPAKMRLTSVRQGGQVAHLTYEFT